MNEELKQAYPLNWPNGWKRSRSHERTRAKFGKKAWKASPYATDGGYQRKTELTITEGGTRIIEELSRMGIRREDVVISTNIPVSRSGLPMARASVPADPGVAIYWKHGQSERCMATDRYDRVADNLAAIAATLDAMRAIERHGGAEILNRAFTGFAALPGGITVPRPWHEVLELSEEATADEVESAFKTLAKKWHPDLVGGDTAIFQEISAAKDEGLRLLRRQSA